jgi:hypothetical protein
VIAGCGSAGWSIRRRADRKHSRRRVRLPRDRPRPAARPVGRAAASE